MLKAMTLTYRWSLLSKPSGSTAMLSLPTSELPYFTPDVVGKYVVQLIVNGNGVGGRTMPRKEFRGIRRTGAKPG